MAASLGRRSATSLVSLLARTASQPLTPTLCRSKAAARQSVSGPALLRARSFGVTHQVLSTVANIPAWKDEHATTSNTVPSPVVTAQQTRSLDQALKQLDVAVKRTGRIRYQLLNDVLRDIVRLDFPGQNHLLLLLRSCGNLMAETLPAERTKFAQAIWKQFGDLGVSYDDSHYNSLLKVYLQNEHTFSPTEFLAQMEKDGVAPNRVTYQRLLARYCNEGNMDGTSTVLEFMKAQDMPLTEHVFSALIIGHTRAGDMASAINVLSVMKDVGIEPSAETHMVMLCAFAEKGDFESIRQFFENENQDVNLLNRHLLEVVYTLAKFGHDQHIDFIIRRLQHKHFFISENMNVCLRLVTQRLLEPAFQLLRFTCEGITDMKNKAFVASLFLKHLINRNVPLETITKYCDLMIEEGMHNNPHENTLLFLLRLDEVDKVIALMKIFQRMGLPIRQHYFWPMLVLQRKVNDKPGVLYILKTMQELEIPPDMETFVKFVQPAFNSLQEATGEFQKCGISFEHSERIVTHIRNITDKGDFKELYELLVFLKSQNIKMTLAAFHKNFISSYWKCADEKLKAQILHLSTSQSYGNPKDSVGEFLLSLFSLFPNNLTERTRELSHLFAELKSLGVFLGVSDIIEITTFLKTHAPSLIEDVKVLEGGNSIAEKLQLQEIILKEKKAEGKPIDLMLRNVIRVASKQDMAKALELMNTYSEDVKEATYNDVIETACSHQDFDTGWKLKKELNARYPSYVLDLRKQLGLAMGLALHDRTQEFQTILHEIPHQNHKQQLVVGLKYKLTELIMQGKAAEAHQLLKTLYDFELIIMNKSLFLPFVSVPLEKGDLAEALDSFIECVQKYSRYPNEYDLFSAMVKANDPELLKKALEAVSDEEYETRVLFNLFFAFLGCKKYKEAQKVIETPAIRAQSRMLQWFAEKCVAENEADILEHMVQMTENLPDCDRDQLYYYLLQICDKNGDSARAQVAWTRMQEENIVPREQTSQLLGTILHGGNPVESGVTSEDFSERREHVVEPEVHQISRIERFILAETKRKPEETLNLLRMNDRGHGFSANTYLHLAKTQLSIGAVNEAQSIMELAKIHHPNIVLDNTGNSLLMTSLVKAGKLEETIELFKFMRKQGQFPNIFALRPCMKALARAGHLEDVDLFCKEHAALEAPSQIPPHFFVQCQILALIARNQLQQAVEVVEGMWEQQADGNFPLYAVFKVLKEDCKDEAFDKFCAIADKKAQQFGKYDNLCEVLFVHLDRGELNEAKHLLQRWPMIAEQELTSWYERNNRKRRDVQIIEKFLEVFPNFQHQYLSYRFLLHHYYFENDFPKAKALYERTKAAQLQLDDLTLKQLAIMYKNSSETLPFPEPPELLSHYTKGWRKPQQQGEHNEPSLNLS